MLELVELVLLRDIAPVEFDKGTQLLHHPGHGNVRHHHVVIATTDVGMCAWEPHLL